MISMQKRKATCPPSAPNNDANAVQNVGTLQPKNSRKKTKFSTVKSAGCTMKRPSSQLTIDNNHHDQQRFVQSGSSSSSNNNNNNLNSNNQDESVWIFGLINNIEQLLSNFTAINNNSNNSSSSPTNKLSTSSGASTPSAPPSSLASSTAPSPPSSFSSSLDSTGHSPQTSTTCNTSTFTSSSSLSSSTSSSSSSPASAVSSTPASGGSLPRSPVSRQIKFHEYKGPPSTKRQQQSTKQQNASTNCTLTSSGPCLQTNNEQSSSEAVKLAANLPSPQQVKQQQQQQQQQVVTSVPVQTLRVSHHQQQQIDRAIILGQKSIVAGQISPFSATIGQQQQPSAQINALRNVSFQQDQMIPANPHSLAAVKSQAHIAQQQHASRRHPHPSQPMMLQQQQQQQQQQPIQVTSGISQAGLQTFYIKQDASGLPHPPPPPPPNGSATFFVERSSKQLDLDDQQQQQQQQQQQYQFEQVQYVQFPNGSRDLASEQRVCNPLVMRSIQQPSNNVPVSGGIGGAGNVNSLMTHTQPDYPEQQCRQQAHMIQVQQRTPVWPARQQQHQQHQQQEQPDRQQVQCATIYNASVNHYTQPITCSQIATTATVTNASLVSTTNTNPTNYANDQFVSNCDDYSPSTSQQHIDEDDLTASFAPDCHETDACEIEPSIGFASGIDELLFSEFIDLQDVPMNVDESDWLKKFLPPCSMG